MYIWIKSLTLEDGKEYFELLSSLSKNEDGPVPSFIEEEDFLNFKKARLRMANNDNLPNTIIPANSYWVMDENKPIGYATLKHYLPSAHIGGHINCWLLKEYQNKGVGTNVAEMLENIAYENLGITEITYATKEENIQSQKSIEKTGGKLTSSHDDYYFYTVDLLKKYNLEKGKEK